MPTEISRCIAEADRRLAALEVLCEMVIGQLKAERRQLEQLKAAVGLSTTGQEDHSPPADFEASMLEG